MIMALVYLLLMLVIVGFVFWAIQQLMVLVPIAEPFRTVIRIVLYAIILIIVVWFILQLVGMLGGAMSLPRYRY